MGALRPLFDRGQYHVTQHATGRDVFFRDDHDYAGFMRTLLFTAKKYDFAIDDYCLMPNHLHLVVGLRRPNLASIMQYLLARHVARFNNRHLRHGHLVESPYRVTVIRDEPHLYRVHRYVAMNPVRAGLCSHPLEWPWCAYSGDGSIAPRPSATVRALVAEAVRLKDVA